MVAILCRMAFQCEPVSLGCLVASFSWFLLFFLAFLFSPWLECQPWGGAVPGRQWGCTLSLLRLTCTALPLPRFYSTNGAGLPPPILESKQPVSGFNFLPYLAETIPGSNPLQNLSPQLPILSPPPPTNMHCLDSTQPILVQASLLNPTIAFLSIHSENFRGHIRRSNTHLLFAYLF